LVKRDDGVVVPRAREASVDDALRAALGGVIDVVEDERTGIHLVHAGSVGEKGSERERGDEELVAMQHSSSVCRSRGVETREEMPC